MSIDRPARAAEIAQGNADAAPIDPIPECPCGSDRLTYGGGGVPYTCAEAFFSLLDDGVIDDTNPLPRLDDGANEEQRNLYQHLVETQVWDEPGEQVQP